MISELYLDWPRMAFFLFIEAIDASRVVRYFRPIFADCMLENDQATLAKLL